jgi:DNA mismatch endonuclease (patch repair protein)
MRAIRDRDTKPEMLVRKFLWAKGLRYRLHVKSLPGKPDLVFPKYKTVVFVHGCFWHMHGCKNFVWPKTRGEFWRAKLTANNARDSLTHLALRRAGWRVLVVWECRLSPARCKQITAAILGKHMQV